MNNSSPSVFTIEVNQNEDTNQIEIPIETIDINKSDQVKNNITIKSVIDGWFQWIKRYINKFHGLHEKRPKRLTWDEYFWSFSGALISMALIAIFHYKLFQRYQLIFLIGSYGASSVIIFCTPRSPVAQPRSLICGHFIGALCGCIVRLAVDPYEHSMGCALAVSISVFIMQLTETLHPPGGATALLAVTIQPSFPWAHFLFIFVPALTGAFIMLIVALIINNIPKTRTYPSFWW